MPISPTTAQRTELAVANCLRYPRIRITFDALIHPYVWVTAHQEAVSNNGTTYDRAGVYERAAAAVAYLADDGLVPVVCAYTLAEEGPATTPAKYARVQLPDGPAVVRLRTPRSLHRVLVRDGRTTIGEVLSMDTGTTPKEAQSHNRAAAKWLKGEYFRQRTAELQADAPQPAPKVSPRVAKAIELVQQAKAAELEAMDRVLLAEGLEGRSLSELLTSGLITLVSTGLSPRRVRTYYRGRRRLLTVIMNGLTVEEIKTF